MPIATREKLLHFAYIGCSPVPRAQCDPVMHSLPDSVPGWEPPAMSPETPDNPTGLQMCYYDERCSYTMPDQLNPGCNAGGLNINCRYCGFGPFHNPCPVVPDCSEGESESWPAEKQLWCCKHYMFGCPHECRNETGSTWTKEKKEWCCKNEAMGCHREVYDPDALDADVTADVAVLAEDEHIAYDEEVEARENVPQRRSAEPLSTARDGGVTELSAKVSSARQPVLTPEVAALALAFLAVALVGAAAAKATAGHRRVARDEMGVALSAGNLYSRVELDQHESMVDSDP